MNIGNILARTHQANVTYNMIHVCARKYLILSIKSRATHQGFKQSQKHSMRREGVVGEFYKSTDLK